MKKIILLFLIIGAIPASFAQNNATWKGYFSFNEIKDISVGDNAFFAATENALFIKNFSDLSVKTKTTIDGLSGQTITAIHHSEALNKTIIGYENGLLIVINEADGSVLKVVDIITNGVNQNAKRVNHFMEYQGIIYIACNFGIVQYNLASLGFGDTYRIGDFGEEIKVTQTTIFNGLLVASTAIGIKSAAINNPNLNDYAQWTSSAGGGWSAIEAIGSELIAVADWTEIYKFNGTYFIPFTSPGIPTKDLRKAGDYLLITNENSVTVYSTNLAVVATIYANQITDFSAKFTCASLHNETLYIGTFENGIVTVPIANPTNFEFMNPIGPAKNNIFSIASSTSNLWAVYGKYTADFNPYPLDYYGISKLTNSNWLNIPYSEVHLPGSNVSDLVRVAIHPTDENKIFVSSYFSGLARFENDQLVTVYNETNSALESIFPTDPPTDNLRIEQAAFDNSGNLWMTNGLVTNGLKVFRANEQWQSYSLTSILSNYFDTRFGKMTIDKNGTKWICSTSGLLAFNDTSGSYKKIKSGAEDGNLPVDDVRAVAIDNNNQLWIGTKKGLRILSSVDRFKTDDQLSTYAIIILEDDLAQELLYEQFITDIVVDGANNKWIGTADSGVFMVSSDGQITKNIFTVNNSPLPSNTINDIEINGATGEVFIATDKGMISYKGTATTASKDLSAVFVYPNPVRPEFQGTVKIAGLLDNCNVKITDIAGNLVYETIAEGGTIEWDTTAFGNYKVASGVYMIFISAEDGLETKVKKVMIIR